MGVGGDKQDAGGNGWLNEMNGDDRWMWGAINECKGQ